MSTPEHTSPDRRLAEEQLLAAGWTPDRRVDVSSEMSAVWAEGYEDWPEVTHFLQQFSGLEISGGASVLWINAEAAAQGVDQAWADRYEEFADVALVPVGGQSHLTIYLGRDGKLYAGFEATFGYLGSTVLEAIDSVLNTDPPIPLGEIDVE